MTAAERLLRGLSDDPMTRLRWMVCRRLAIPAGSLRERLLSDRQVLNYAGHMVLDEQENACGSGGSFDPERFEELRRHS